MAKLYFYYSAMNAGKSTTLLQSSFNYQERGMSTFLLTAELDQRYDSGKITSRIGLEERAHLFNEDSDLFDMVDRYRKTNPVNCVLVDEAQFLNKKQVWQLCDVCDQFGIPVLCYGIRTDFRGELFCGSQWLLAWADELNELKTICHCGKKATMVLRIDESGQPVKEGSQIEIGGNDKYISVCRAHFKASLNKLD